VKKLCKKNDVVIRKWRITRK